METLVDNFLTGPTSISYHPNVYGRNFYIFGDTHESFGGSCSKKSKNLINFLNEAFENTKVKIDFFIEAAYQISSVHLEVIPRDELMKFAVGYLSSVIYNFAHCLTPDKTICNKEYNNLVRFHYIDIRQKYLEDQQDGPLFSFFWLLNRNYQNYILGPDTLRDMLLDYLKMNTFDWAEKYVRNNPNFVEDDFMEAHELREKPGVNRIIKQLDGISDKKIKNKIWQYFNDKSEELLKRYESLYNNMNFQELDNINNLTDELQKNFEHIKMIITTVEVLIMDIYLLGRIFKDSLSDSDEVWIYVGAHHAANIKKFIVEYLKIPKHYYTSKYPADEFDREESEFLMSDESSLNEIRCQNIGGIKQMINIDNPKCTINQDGTVICNQANKCIKRSKKVSKGKIHYYCKGGKCSQINEDYWPGNVDHYDCI